MSTRLAILADVHLPAPGTDARAAALVELFRRAIEKVRALNVDWVVLLGDTVELGTRPEYALAREITAPLLLKLKPLTGNHEYAKGTPADFRGAWLVEPAAADLIGNLPVMRFDTGVEGQADDEYFGRVTPPQLKLFDALLAARLHLPSLVFSHHPMRDTVRRSSEPNFALENSQDLRERVEKHVGGAVIFSGHTHWQSVVKLSNRVTCIGCPPLGYWPHAFLSVEIEENVLRYETVRLIELPDQSPDEHANDAAYRADAEGNASDRAGSILLDHG